MKTLAAAWCAVLFLGLVLPAAAQVNYPVFAEQLNPNSIVFPDFTPSPQDIAKQAGAETPSVTNVAKGIYARLTGGSLDGYRLTADLQQAWTPSLEAKASQQLASWGTPSWSFVGNGLTSAGVVSVYRLAYAKGGPVYMSVGVADNGVVYDLRLATSARKAAPPPAR